MIIYSLIALLNLTTNKTLLISSILYLPFASIGYFIKLTPITYHLFHQGLHVKNFIAFVAGALILSTIHDYIQKKFD